MTVQEWLGEDNQLGIDIWNKKYRQNNESFDEWLDRVSGGNEDIRQLIKERKFLFGGRILSNRGLDKLGKKITLSNCYVIAPPEDNLESIFDAASKLARTYSYGGGCGIDISKLSPRGAKINNAAESTSGSVSFMDLYNLTTELIGQNGRRGALMISLSCDHPDLEEFIEIKSDLDKITKANISIRITDEFMDAVIDRQPFDLTFVREQTGEVITKTVDAHEIFKKICEMNWKCAEPGVLFWDQIKYWNLLSENDDFEFAGVNPCAEEPLPAGGSCLLGSINLAEFVTDHYTFDTCGFVDAVKKSVVALNEVLDEGLPLHPLQEQRDSVRDWRQIGLGVFGLADMLIKMGIRYGSKRAIALCEHIGSEMIDTAILTSAELAKEKGAYPKYKSLDMLYSTKFYSFNVTGENENIIEQYGLHNSQLLSIAPTGSISTMLGVSGGIEPIYANYYERKTESLHGHDEYYKVYTPIVKQYMDEYGIIDDKDLPDYFVTAKNIPWKERIDMQATWQNFIDASISSTVNVPNDFTVEEVMELYTYAWKCNLKGVTIFRDGCDREGILSEKSNEDICETSNKEELELVYKRDRGEIIKVSDNCIGRKRTLRTGCGTLHCEAFFDPDNGDLLELYLSKGSTGGCNNFMIGLSRMVSLSARGGISIYDIVDQLQSSGTCPSYAVRRATKKDTSLGSSCPVAVGKALIDMYDEVKARLTDSPSIKLAKYSEIAARAFTDGLVDAGVLCPECGSELIFEGGCNTCRNCGYSKCD